MRDRRLLKTTLLALNLLLLAAGALAHAGETPARAAAALRQQQTLPILMYHSILKNPDRAGDYVLSPAALEADLRYLSEHGYETVVMADVIAFVRGEGTLPARPVMLTFDDGFYNNLVYVLPLLRQYDMRAVLSPVGSYAEEFTKRRDPNPNYAYLAWDELETLEKSGRFEIQNHSYDLHALDTRRGSSNCAGESEAAYRAVFTEDAMRMQEQLAAHGIDASTYTYPYGAIGANSGSYLREMGFSASLSCFERTNLITAGDPDCLFCLGRYNRPADVDTEAFMARALADGA